MEERYPIVVEGDWGSEHAKSVKNKLHIHFQSKKKSQGGDCVVQYDKNNSATILFKSPDIRDAVLSQEKHIITIDGQKIELKVYKPSDVKEQADSTGQRVDQACAYQEPNESAHQTDLDVNKPQESNAVVLENLPDDIKQEVLTLLVENISNLSEKDFTIELISELRKAVVTFKNPSDAEKFLEVSRTHDKFKKKNLKAHALERSTCVRVENLPAEANEMLLDLYFEKYAGPIEEVKTIPSENTAIITFKEEEAKEKVLKRENIICDVPVKIYPYFKSLDTVLYGGNRPHLKLPEPFTVSVHPAIREFLLKKGEISSIKDQMSSHFCQINMDKPEALLSPDPALLKQKGVSRRHIDGWNKNACDAFKNILSNYTTSEWPVSHLLWSKVENDVKELVKGQVFTDMDPSKGVLTLAGMTHEITGLKPIMEKILERATNQIEREKNSVTETMEMSPAMYSLLLQDGLKSAASPQLHIDYNKKMNSLGLSGLHTETLAFKNWVLEKKLIMKQKPLKMDCSILEFLRLVDCDEMSTDLFISHGISAVYTIENEEVVVTGSTQKALAEAEKRLNMVLTSKELIIEDQGVLQMQEWQDLKGQLQELFNTSKKISVFINLSKQRDKVIVTGFKEPVMEVSDNLGRFIEKHTRIEETVRVESHAAVEFIKDRKSQDWQNLMKSDEVKVSFDSKRPRIKLSGERIFVQPAMTFFKRLTESLYMDTLIIKKAGAKKYFKEQGNILLSVMLKEKRFVVVLQEDDMLEQEEDILLPGPLGRVSASFLGMDSMQVYGQNQSIFRRSGEKVEEDKSLLTKIKDIFSQVSSESPTNEEFVMVVEEIEPAVFQLCGETKEDLREAKDMINSLIGREHMATRISNPAIAYFTKEDGEMLNRIQREFTVSVQLEKKGQDSVITLEGLTRDVHSAESRIRDMIHKVERNENERRGAFLISSMVKWQYLENRNSVRNFDVLTNYELEMAFQKKQPSVRIKINNDEYVVDLVRKKATRGRITIELNRVDLQDAAQSSLPSHWEDMKGKPVVLVKLSAGSKEYAEVGKAFRRTGLSSNITEIERVQNSTLWRNYMIKKEQLDDKNNHKNNEKHLFHGTGADKTDQINHHGFNRRYSGTHGAMYGNGSYFAVDPSYSARGYSKPDAKGHKRMYLARVLVGDYTQGTAGLPVPPAKSSNSADLYDSVTDNINNPTMFVIFNDVQAYPEYLITFQ